MVSTLPISGLATRLAAPARHLATRLSGLKRTDGESEPAGVPAAPAAGATPPQETGLSLDGKIHVPVLDEPQEAALWQAAVMVHAEMARAGRWSELLEVLRKADQDRTPAPGGRRLACIISRGARLDVTEALAAKDWTAAEAAMDRLADALSAFRDHYPAAHLLAQAHLDFGWARRNADNANSPSREVWQFFLRQTELAEEELDRFDPLEETSAILAASRYYLARGIEDGDEFFRDWYEDWSDLDPMNPDPHATHAVLLMPKWFGSLASFDDEARSAMRRTEACSGATAYAVYYMAAHEQLNAYPPGMELPLYLTGLLDYYHGTECQYRANIAARAMAELLKTYVEEARPGASRLTLVQDTLTRHLRENLREFHRSAWDGKGADIDFALSRCFAAELQRGDHVYVGTEGLTTHLPA